MSEFVDPIKKVKSKVKFLDQASSIIKLSRKQQLDRQREIKGLEVAKTEEYAKQAKPIVEAIGTQPSEEEKRLTKENDRSIVSNGLSSNGIPTTDPSYNIILKLFDDSYDVIKSRKTESLKQRDINLMVESVQSIIGDVLPLDGSPYSNVYENSSPISFLAKNIFQKIFLNKDYTLSESQLNDIQRQEEAIQDRERTEAERIALETEAKAEEEAKISKEKRSEAQLEKIEENKTNDVLRGYMFDTLTENLKKEKYPFWIRELRQPIIDTFNFIHPEIINEPIERLKESKINDFLNSVPFKKKVSSLAIRTKIKNALLKTYPNSITKLASGKYMEEGLLSDIKKIHSEPAPEPAPAPAPSPAPAPAPAEPAPVEPAPATPIKPKVDVVPDTPEVEPIPSESKSDDPKRIDTYFLKNRDNVAKSGSGKVFKYFSGFKNKVNREMVKEWSANDRLYFQIRATKQFIDLQNKEPDTPSKNKAIIEAKEFMDKSLSNFVDNEELKNLSTEIARPILGKGLKKGKAQKGGFNFLSMFAPIPLVGNGQLTMEDLRTKTSSGIKKKVLDGKGMTILNPKNFQKGMKKKANEDLLHNLQVHMAQVQAGNNNLKQPISMLVDEAVGRGIMKKQVGNKIKKHFVN